MTTSNRPETQIHHGSQNTLEKWQGKTLLEGEKTLPQTKKSREHNHIEIYIYIYYIYIIEALY
jgi:hypothetical protein